MNVEVAEIAVPILLLLCAVITVVVIGSAIIDLAFWWVNREGK